MTAVIPVILLDISIHAPLRGATCAKRVKHVARLISIHAPLRGATEATIERLMDGEFQSTPPCGSDA